MASILDPAASTTSEGTTRTRSCQKCNQRKTRCSKTQPCVNCVKLGMECIFPPPGRAPRRKKRALKAELVSKVQLLEKRVRELEDERVSQQSVVSPQGEKASINTDPQQLVARPYQASHSKALCTDKLDVHSGQLVVEGGSSRYVSHEALASLQTEVSNIVSSCFELC